MKPLYQIRGGVTRRAIKVMSAICALAAIGGVGTVRAANCPVSFYLDSENECTVCDYDYYCPGDDISYKCPEDKWAGKYEQFFDDTFISFGAIWYRSWAGSLVHDGMITYYRPSITACHRNTYFYTKNYTCLSQVAYDTTSQEYPVKCTHYYEPGPGYYLSPYLDESDYIGYNGVKPCTNAPANAHYTGPGTPDSKDDKIKDANDCPWECDDGFGHTSDDRCLPLCRIGETAMNGINIYAEKHTKYAIAVPRGDGMCWISAKRDNGGKLVPTN